MEFEFIWKTLRFAKKRPLFKKKYNETIEKGVAFRKISTFKALFYKKFIFFN